MRGDNEDIPLLPSELAGAEVTPNLRCRACGYNLHGLRADGDCPECGLAIWRTILRETDPEISRLPRLHDARGVGNALVLLVAIMLVAGLMIAVGPVAARVESWGVQIPARLAFLQSPMMPYLTGVVVLVGLWSVWKLMPGRHDNDSPMAWRDIRLIGLGLVGWSVMFLLLGSVFNAPQLEMMRSSTVLVSHAFAASVLLGLRGVFRAIGERSRAYRRSREGRQNVGTMVAALLGVAAGDAIQLMHEARVVGDLWLEVATILRWVSGFMLLVGFVYLLGNAWWVRRAIARPPRSLDELLMPAMRGQVRLGEGES